MFASTVHIGGGNPAASGLKKVDFVKLIGPAIFCIIRSRDLYV